MFIVIIEPYRLCCKVAILCISLMFEGKLIITIWVCWGQPQFIFFYKFKRDFNLNLRLGYLLKPACACQYHTLFNLNWSHWKKKVLENELLYIILTSKKDIAWGYCNHITNTNSVCQWAHNDFKIISIETIAWAFLEL